MFKSNGGYQGRRPNQDHRHFLENDAGERVSDVIAYQPMKVYQNLALTAGLAIVFQ